MNPDIFATLVYPEISVVYSESCQIYKIKYFIKNPL